MCPDLEESTFAALERGDDSKVTPLLEAHLASLAQLQPVVLRAAYDSYWNTLSEADWIWTITDPAVLATLKSTGTASIPVSLAALPDDHAELKIVRVELALIGATTKANHSWVPVTLHHDGAAMNRRQDKAFVHVAAAPRANSVSATTVPTDLDQLDNPDKQQFWGRSPITTWRIDITPKAATNAGLDLSGVSQVDIVVRYKYRNPTAAKIKN